MPEIVYILSGAGAAMPAAVKRCLSGVSAEPGICILVENEPVTGHEKFREAAVTVRAILTAKGFDVETIEPTVSIAAATKRLAERRIGALVVEGADDRVVGIISERDIVFALAEQGAGVLDEPVSLVMTRKVETCHLSETVASVMERMTAGKFRHVPVIENNRLAGIISIGDVVKHRLGEIEGETAALRDYILTA
jgi:CBS domain-containing protein